MIKHDDRSLSETAVSLPALKSYIGGWIESRFGSLAGSGTVPGNEELECFHLKDFCDAVHHIDGRAVNASFQGTDVGAMDVCTVREFLLRKPPGVSQRPEIERKDLSNIHDPESCALQCIQLQSILCNRYRPPLRGPRLRKRRTRSMVEHEVLMGNRHRWTKTRDLETCELGTRSIILTRSLLKIMSDAVCIEVLHMFGTRFRGSVHPASVQRCWPNKSRSKLARYA